MMGELIVRNLLHRPMRTLIGAMGVAVEVALVILIVGLTSGLLAETAKRIEGIGADIMLQPPAASIIINFSGSPMPIKIGDKVAELKYVRDVAPFGGLTRTVSARFLPDLSSLQVATWRAPTTCWSTTGRAKPKT